MKKQVGLVPSNQNGNAVKGGGNEAQYATDISRRIAALLDPVVGCKVFTGTAEGNADGARAAVAWGAGLVISLHTDGGYEYGSHCAALMCYQEDDGKAVGEYVAQRYCDAVGFAYRGAQYRPTGTPAKLGVAVLRIPEAAGIPAFLLEYGWHDREPDASYIRDPGWRQRAADAIATAVLEWMGIEQSEEEEMADFKEFAGREKDEKGRFMLVCEEGYLNKLLLVNTWDAADIAVEVFVDQYAGMKASKVFTSDGWAKGGTRGAQISLADAFPGLSGRFSVEVHSPAPVNAGWAR